jgi:hypothetical protein
VNLRLSLSADETYTCLTDCLVECKNHDEANECSQSKIGYTELIVPHTLLSLTQVLSQCLSQNAIDSNL